MSIIILLKIMDLQGNTYIGIDDIRKMFIAMQREIRDLCLFAELCILLLKHVATSIKSYFPFYLCNVCTILRTWVLRKLQIKSGKLIWWISSIFHRQIEIARICFVQNILHILTLNKTERCFFGTLIRCKWKTHRAHIHYNATFLRKDSF